MPYDDEYQALVNDVFTESINGHFYRGYTILGGSERKLHFTLVSQHFSVAVYTPKYDFVIQGNP